VQEIEIETFFACWELATVHIESPSGLHTISSGAFQFCSSLESIVIPSGVGTIGAGAFWDTFSLTEATFLGHAPIVPGSRGVPFLNPHPDFVIHHAAGAAGFSSPDWDQYTKIVETVPLEIEAVVKSDGRVIVRLAPAFLVGIGVEYSPDLSEGSWIELGNFSNEDGVITFVDEDQTRANRDSGYYRAFQRPHQ